jgi:hypothetical protein
MEMGDLDAFQIMVLDAIDLVDLLTNRKQSLMHRRV